MATNSTALAFVYLTANSKGIHHAKMGEDKLFPSRKVRTCPVIRVSIGLVQMVFLVTATIAALTPAAAHHPQQQQVLRLRRHRGQCLQPFLIVWLSAHCKSTCGLCSARIVRIG
uniref:ShKT domain-containing protein n=1 Tax=Globodera pallida TaxID=36090 RepID=A0A183CLF8_GLOPA